MIKLMLKILVVEKSSLAGMQSFYVLCVISIGGELDIIFYINVNQEENIYSSYASWFKNII